MVSAVVGVRIERTYCNPLSLFATIFGVILILYALNPYGINAVSEDNMTYFCLGITVFCVSYMLCHVACVKMRQVTGCIRRGSTSREHMRTLGNSTNASLVAIYVACTLSAVYYFIVLVSALMTTASFNLGDIHTQLRETTGASFVDSSIIRGIGAFIVGPISTALPIVVAVEYALHGSVAPAVYTGIVLVIKTAATSSRAAVLVFPIYLVVAIILRKTVMDRRPLFEGFAIKRRHIGVVAGFICLFLVVSISRGADFRDQYLHFSIQPEMFSQWVDYTDSTGLTGYGMASLQGLLYTPAYLIKQLFGSVGLLDNYWNVYDLVELTDSHWIYPGDGIRANAYVTCFWYFYLDGRVPGIVIGSLLFAACCKGISAWLHASPSRGALTVYLLMLTVVMYCFVRFQPALPNFALCVIYALLYLQIDNVPVRRRNKRPEN